MIQSFFYKTALFLLPIVVLSALLEFSLRRIPNDYASKNAFYQTHGKSISVLSLGSSQGLYAINPKHFSTPAFNGAHVSQSLYYDWLLLKHFGDRLDSLKHLIVPVGYFTMYYKLETGPEPWRVRSYYIHYGLPMAQKLSDRLEILSFDLGMNMKRWWQFYVKGMDEIKTTPTGFGNNYTVEARKNVRETAIAEAKRHTVMDTSNLSYNLVWLDSMVQWTAKRNIKLWLVIPPAHEAYRQAINESDWAKAKLAIDALEDRSAHVKLLDFFEAKGIIEEYFYDADHLNARGAASFTRVIDSILISRRPVP